MADDKLIDDITSLDREMRENNIFLPDDKLIGSVQYNTVLICDRRAALESC